MQLMGQGMVHTSPSVCWIDTIKEVGVKVALTCEVWVGVR